MKRIAGILVAMAAIAAFAIPSAASAATVQQTLRADVAFNYNVPVTRVDVNASPYDTFTGFYCRVNHTQFLFSGYWTESLGHVGGGITWTSGSTIPCDPNANQEPFA